MIGQAVHCRWFSGAGNLAGVLSLLFCISLLCSGCSVIRQDVGQPLVVDLEALAAAPDYHQVLRMLGPPHKLSRTEHGMVFLYEEIDLTEKQLGISLATDDIALFKAVIAREVADRQVLLVTFDAAGNTQAIGYRKWSDIAAQGGALQFAFVVADVADAGDLNDSPMVHEWGFGLLEGDLPKLLNRQHSLGSGNAGVDQKGTPTHVGQSALELR